MLPARSRHCCCRCAHGAIMAFPVPAVSFNRECGQDVCVRLCTHVCACMSMCACVRAYVRGPCANARHIISTLTAAVAAAASPLDRGYAALVIADCCWPWTPTTSNRIRFVLHRCSAHVVQIMLLGDSSTGKTCLLIRFKDNTFLNNNFISTVGIDYRASREEYV